MQYNFNGNTIVIPDGEVNKLMSSLELSKQEAIDLWLSDNGYEDNEEQIELNEKASKVRILKEVDKKVPKKERKPVIKSVSDEKKALFSEILSGLQDVYKKNVTVLTENKLISIKINGKTFKIDVIEQRKPKN